MFKNNWRLCKFYLRQDWFAILIWFALNIALNVGFGAGIAGMYPDQASLDAMVEPLQSPAFKAMLGNVHLTDGVLTLGGMYSVYMAVWAYIIIGCMSVHLLIRHTRRDEEQGRLEVIRSLPVGRLANLSAALTELIILHVLLAVLIGLGLGAVGDPDRGMDFAGAFALAGGCAAFGIITAGVTAVFCQLNKNPGASTAFSFCFIGFLYLLFMMGAMQGSDTLYNLSLIGLIHNSKPYVENDWTPIVIATVIGVVLIIKGLWLCKIRDLGESLIPAKPGRADAKASLSSPGGLAWRLLKGWAVFWAFMLIILGAAYGSVMSDIETFIESNEVFRQISQGNVMVMASTFLLIGTLIAVIPILQFMLKARAEEKRGLAENILARSVSKSGQLRGYFVISLVACLGAPILTAAGFYMGSAAVMEDPIPFVNWLIACSVYAPGILVMMGVAVALIGLAPKFTGLAWWYLAYTFVALYLGMLVLPEKAAEFLAKLTPFGHTPKLPYVEKLGEAPYVLADGTPLLNPETGEQVIMPIFADEATYSLTSGNVTALTVMTVIAAALIVLGFIGYKRREMKFSH